MLPKFLWVLRGNRTFFFLDGFIETRTKNGGFTCWFGVRTLNLWWFQWNRGGEVGRRRPPTSPKYPRFRWIPPQVFKFLLQTNTWIPPFFCPSFNEYRQEKNKKYVRVSNETIHLLFFDQIFTNEYHQFSANSFKISF